MGVRKKPAKPPEQEAPRPASDEDAFALVNRVSELEAKVEKLERCVSILGFNLDEV